jgi:5,10-methylenetetrahydrofolate reductase
MNDACPKEMRFGPCGGVRPGGSCEVDGRLCPFLGAGHDAVLSGAAAGLAREVVPLALPAPAVVVDVRAPARWPGDERRLWRATAAALPGCVALLGEHVDNPRGADDAGQVDPTVAIEELASGGIPVIATVTGRDRDLDAARITMRRYHAAGATAIHCVTGDHPQALAIPRPATFGAEAVSLVALANDLGLAATVGESPASPGARVERMALKRAAGAGACILNHCGEVEQLERFAEACAHRGVDLPLIAPIPMVADRWAATALVRFPGLRLPQRFIDVVTTADDPAQASIELAGRMSAQLAGSGCFAGVNLSGSATGVDPYARIELTARFAEAVHDAWNSARRPRAVGGK